MKGDHWMMSDDIRSAAHRIAARRDWQTQAVMVRSRAA
jgi:hypothetical protein